MAEQETPVPEQAPATPLAPLGRTTGQSLWRLVDSGARPAAENMAVDEAILLAHSRGEVPPTLRFYGWEPAAVSIGYFQKMTEEVDLEALAAAGYEYVRRQTGGRAIFHHIELTYSVTIHQDLLAGSLIDTYQVISTALVDGLRRLGVPAELAGGEPDPRKNPAAADEFNTACFDTPSAYELIVGGRKLVGSAQTRQHGVILQHGSILLDLDVEKLMTMLRVPAHMRERAAQRISERAVGLREVLGRPVSYREVARAVADGFVRQLNLELRPEPLTGAEQADGARLIAEKYGNDDWNRKK